jgi:hypothetical protein
MLQPPAHAGCADYLTWARARQFLQTSLLISLLEMQGSVPRVEESLPPAIDQLKTQVMAERDRLERQLLKVNCEVTADSDEIVAIETELHALHTSFPWLTSNLPAEIDCALGSSR